MTGTLVSPLTGAPLRPSGPNLLVEPDGRRWPVLDGIAYLRAGREKLVATALAQIDAGACEAALVTLLADQDDWWDEPEPDEKDLSALVTERDMVSLRTAMTRLGYGRVGDYFAHRWSDPTFLAGLALLEAHWKPTVKAFELACGIGHYLRELMRHGVAATGIDVVFSKLWLARHWVLGPEARLICCDAAAPWPIGGEAFDLVFCHDAFYFLAPKETILGRLRALTAPAGRLALSHIHNAEADNMSAGQAVSMAEMAAFFPNGTFYDDAELTQSLIEARAPRAAPLDTLRQIEAFACEDGASLPPRAVVAGLAMPAASAPLQINPLYGAHNDGLSINWPSARYRAEYAQRATYPLQLPAVPEGVGQEAATRRRILVDVPERW